MSQNSWLHYTLEKFWKGDKKWYWPVVKIIMFVPSLYNGFIVAWTRHTKDVTNLAYPPAHESNVTFVQTSAFKFWDKHTITNGSWFCESDTLHSQSKTIISAHNCILNVSFFFEAYFRKLFLQYFQL